VEHDQVPAEAAQPRGQMLEMVPSFGEDDRRTPLGYRRDDVVEDHGVPRVVSRERGVEALDPSARFGRRSKRGATQEEPLREGALRERVAVSAVMKRALTSESTRSKVTAGTWWHSSITTWP
jgi:hypothetical protein